MKTVITINEENHGQIGIAKNYVSAIDFLINDYWLTGDNEVECEKNLTDDYSVFTVLGEDWQEKVKALSIDEFNELFMWHFELTEVEVYGA